MRRSLFSLILLLMTLELSAQYISFHHGSMFTTENKLVTTEVAKELFNETEYKEFNSAYNEYIAGSFAVWMGVPTAVLGLTGMYFVYKNNPYVFDLLNGKREYEYWMNEHAGGYMVMMEVLSVAGLASTALGLFPTIHGKNRLKRFAYNYNSKQSLQFQVSPISAGIALAF